jgi:hypothetical protein
MLYGKDNVVIGLLKSKCHAITATTTPQVMVVTLKLEVMTST